MSNLGDVHPLLRAAGSLADRALGLTSPPVPYDRTRVDVPMPDGTVLVGTRYRPSRTDGPLPVVLIRVPYDPRSAGIVFAAPLARRGFQVVLQSTRGTFGSGGHFRPFTSEREDGLATVAWLREQPWCDGRIATTGGSYLGYTQWAVAPYADPPLTAMSPHITAARMTDTFYAQGAPALLNALAWTAMIGTQERGGIPLLPHPIRAAKLRRALRRVPLQAADVEVAGAPVPYWRDFVEHAEPGDGYWDATYGESPAFDRAGPGPLAGMPPVSMVTGWWDLFVAEQMRDYRALRAAGVPARVVVGPWLHGALEEVRTSLRTDVAWLDHHLRGGPEPEGAPVRLFLQQADQWLEFEEWPPPATAREVHLQAAGRLGEEPGTGVSTYVYDPADPTPSVGGPLLQPPGEQVDQSPVEARADVLVFTGDPLPADLDVVGPVTAVVHVRPELDHADVFVRVCDVDERGVSRNVVDGIRRLDPRTVPAPDVTAGEDGVLAVEIELFPTAYRFRAGHRLRVQVAGGAFPRFARNVGTGEPFGVATRGKPGAVEVLHDADHPSRIVLPVL